MSMSASSSERDPVEQLADEFLERYRRGERPVLTEYTQRYPQWAERIRKVFPALVMMEGARPDAADVTGNHVGGVESPGERRLERLGDYRILREVGRGGMGIVYEAEQESLGRHVALKVLPSHALLDPRHLQRFQREARAAARLHHTNIVPVYGVGEAEGLHYYVMQFIPGLGLDEVLVELQRLRQSKKGSAGVTTGGRHKPVSAAAVARGLLTGHFEVGPSMSGPAALPILTSPHSPQGEEAEPPAPLSSTGSGVRKGSTVHLPGQTEGTSLSETGRPYWHSVARIGVQVAEALAYANGQGVLHRDIKPSNLLLDTQGNVWVTDFGLAKAAGSEDLTHTGDIVGTMRYLAPERFQGRADARSDVYALGLTLYELLTLRPAFDETDKNKLIARVMHAEPLRPRQLAPEVPRDLETIVLKAMERDAARRYPTPEELAADLRRFVTGEPIRARRVSPTERLWRWCRRNPVVAGLAASLVLVFLSGFAGVAWKWQEVEWVKLIAREAGHKEDTYRVFANQHANQSRRSLYASEMSLAYQEWVAGDIGRARNLLYEQWHRSGLEDLRGFEWSYLWSLCQDGSRQTLRTHTNGVLQQQELNLGRGATVAFLRDGKTLVTSGFGGGVCVWDMATQRHVKLLGISNSVACASDGNTLALVQEMGHTVCLWDVAARRERATFAHEKVVFSVAFSPVSKLLAVGCQDQNVWLWDVATRQKVGTLKGHGYSPT
jgi:serine/threonine protein kinase